MGSDTPLSPTVKNRPYQARAMAGTVPPTGASAAADPEMSPTELRYNPAKNAAAAALTGPCQWPPSPPPVHWHRQVHTTQCRHTDEEEGRPRLGGRIPEPGLAETGGRQAQLHQRQGPP